MVAHKFPPSSVKSLLVIGIIPYWAQIRIDLLSKSHYISQKQIMIAKNRINKKMLKGLFPSFIKKCIALSQKMEVEIEYRTTPRNY